MYYHSKKTDLEMDDAIRVLKEALAAEGFGVLMELDIQKTLKEKTGEDIQPYVILGACNPSFALKALRTEDKIGTLLPCNVIVQKTNSGKTEIAAVDPVASLSVVGRPDLEPIADVIKTKLLRVIHSL
jgi:uncharacterized protein (DUF302 family)